MIWQQQPYQVTSVEEMDLDDGPPCLTNSVNELPLDTALSHVIYFVNRFE